MEINQNATFQKNNNKDNKMIRMGNKTELFINPTISHPPISLYTNAETRVEPVIVSSIIPTLPSMINIQTPRTSEENMSNSRKYTEEELNEKKMTKPKLQEILKERNLKISGNKPELIIRILSSQ